MPLFKIGYPCYKAAFAPVLENLIQVARPAVGDEPFILPASDHLVALSALKAAAANGDDAFWSDVDKPEACHHAQAYFENK
jgi:hypothetical protein